jgi:hypothetical protein
LEAEIGPEPVGSLPGSRKVALQAIGKCAESAYRSILSGPADRGWVKDRENRDEMSGEAGKASAWRRVLVIAKRPPCRKIDLR